MKTASYKSKMAVEWEIDTVTVQGTVCVCMCVCVRECVCKVWLVIVC